MTSILGRSSTIKFCAVSTVGRILLFTSVARASILSELLRTATYRATKIPAWTATATLVTAMKNFRRVSSMAAPQTALGLRLRSCCSSLLKILAWLRSGGGRLVICLAAGLVSVAELLFLLIEHVASAIHPVIRLFARPASLLARLLAAFLRFGAKHVACFFSGVRRVQHTDYSSHAKPRQEPQKAIAITIRHNYLLK